MKRTILFLATIVAFGVLSVPALAQDGTTPGPVLRITYYKAVPGRAPDIIRDMREHLKPVYDEYKQQGLILDYHVLTNVTTDGPNDWDIGLVVAFRNFAALDSFPEKTGPITLKHYGSAEKRTEAGRKRNEMRTVVSSRLLRELGLNPLP